MRSALASAAAVLMLGALAAARSVTLTQTGEGWPACDPGVNQYSGYLDISDATDKHYFYWMFEAKQNASTAPVILWMTGGPGCSGSLAILVENGPCHINLQTGDMYSNPYSWNNIANIIYIDQPAGVGFSYSNAAGYDHNETEVADDMFSFFQAFYTKYPQFKSNPLFIYGESYGGHYAPATAHRLWKGNQDNEGIHVPLTGLSVGNGMTDPVVQFQWYGKLANQWCQVVKGEPCISESTYEQMQSAVPGCVALADGCQTNVVDCDFAFQDCASSQLGPFQETGINVYDIRIPCEVPGLCYDFSKATAFMNRQDVQESLGVASRGITWQSCNMQVNQMFGSDWTRDFNGTIPDLLDAGIRVLIYAGDVDFICNWLGNKAWTLGLEWSGSAQYKAALDLPWWLEEAPAGRFRTVSGNNNNLLYTFLQIHDAGHLVPMNQPLRALTMIEHFLNDIPFYGYGGPQPSNVPTPTAGPTPTAAPTTPGTFTMPPSTTAAPSGSTFTQKICTSSTCAAGSCQDHTLPTGQCLSLANGESAIATCGPEYLHLEVYTGSDCTGLKFPQDEPLNQCGADAEGTYVENICSSSSKTVMDTKNVRLHRTKKQ